MRGVPLCVTPLIRVMPPGSRRPPFLISQWSAGATLPPVPSSVCTPMPAGAAAGSILPASALRPKAWCASSSRKPAFAVAAAQARSLRTCFFIPQISPPTTSPHPARSRCFCRWSVLGIVVYVDGGFFDKLPIDAAVAMGATRVIAVDCLRLGPRWVTEGLRLVQFLRPRRKTPQDIDLKVIAPRTWLGEGLDAIQWSRTTIDRWGELGYQDAFKTLII